ncbi:SpoIIE family protein phosphatase [Wenjunlia tyrosinilytica]|nr:SpoIIE family protein phosphatase [Wenjunlia tyrosinilytica]
MSAPDVNGTFEPAWGPAPPGELLDLLRVAAVVVDTKGRIALWSPGAEELFGYTAEEALGQYAGELVLTPEGRARAIELFKGVRTGRSWAGVFPIRHKDGSVRQVEFRTMRLRDQSGNILALGLAADRSTLHDVETRLAVSDYLVEQAPVGMAFFNTDLRCMRANQAMDGIVGMPPQAYVGLPMGTVPGLDVGEISAAMRRVLVTGEPLVDVQGSGSTPADPGNEHVWSVSYYRLQEPSGRVLGVADWVVDITDRHRAAVEAAQARERLALVADASARVGTALDLRRTAEELAEVTVPRLGDMAAVDVLDSVLVGEISPHSTADGPAAFRALARKATGDTLEAVRDADPVGALTQYGPERLITQSVRQARPILVPRVTDAWLPRIAGNEQAARVLRGAGLHSCMALPLIARGNVLGALSLFRTGTPRPFDEQDLLLAGELAARAAVGIDNARLYARERETALTLQRSLLPAPPPELHGMEIASRYRPAASAAEVGGDWFDVLPLKGGRVGLVIGDVMGSGVRAAAIMGQLRTTIRAFATLDLPPAPLLGHLDALAETLGDSFATCTYAVFDPRTRECEFATAGHLPPAIVHSDGRAELLALPPAAPLGVGGVPFTSVTSVLPEGALIALYTDGLVERRHESIDTGLEALLSLLEGPARPLEAMCDSILDTLHHSTEDDVALLLARTTTAGPPDAAATDRVTQ